jgi:hypothetical protein
VVIRERDLAGGEAERAAPAARLPDDPVTREDGAVMLNGDDRACEQVATLRRLAIREDASDSKRVPAIATPSSRRVQMGLQGRHGGQQTRVGCGRREGGVQWGCRSLARPTGVPRVSRQITIVLTAMTGLLLLARAAAAQDDPTPPVPLSSLKDEPGGHPTTMAERNPLSVDLKAVAKRLGLPVPAPAPAAGHAGATAAHPSRATPAAAPTPADVTDYDLAKEQFYVYVPAKPADDGKYGVMVGQCFKEYAGPPKAWPAVLDAHHLIWIGAKDAGDGKTPCHRVGLLLDAAHNVAKVWPVDPDRVYLSMMTFTGPTAGAAMDYPDVFGGEIQSIAVPWYAKIKTSGKAAMTYNTDNFPQPPLKYLSVAKSHSRFYLAPRVDSAADVQWDVVLKRGYKAASFQYVTAEPVPGDKMSEYWELGGDWFDRGVTFLDAPLAELRAKAKPHVNPLPKPPAVAP